jgi:LssY C-terminus
MPPRGNFYRNKTKQMLPAWVVLALIAVLLEAVSSTSSAQSSPTPAVKTTTTETSAQSTTSNNTESYAIEMSGAKQWMDTGIDLRAGEKLHITAAGTITYAKGNQFGPEGIPRGYADLIHEYAVPDGGHGELIGRIGSGAASNAFAVGSNASYTAPVAGRLFLGLNQSLRDAAGAEGLFQVNVKIVDRGLATSAASPAGGPAETPIPAITPRLVDSIPRRVTDQNHSPGDMVNILIVGTEAEVIKAFTTAEWVKVDKSVEGTVIAGLLDTLEKKDYLTMPMSTLYLFGRPQDYGFAHGEPVRVMMSRNHLRVWKSPYKVNGRPLWCVAATHDIGFERDQRNNGVTHKIDPAIDGERDYVNETLSGTGLVSARSHVVPTKPLTMAKTATGREFHSDGRILALILKSGGN